MPIYDDAAAVAASINRLKNIQGLAYLLASWMDPVAGSVAYINDG